MSAPKRTRQRQSDAAIAQALRPAKRTKTAQDTPSTLTFLTDERQRAGRVLDAKLTNGVDKKKRIDQIDESRPVVTGQAAVGEAADFDLASVVSVSSEEPTTKGESDDDLEMQLDGGQGGLTTERRETRSLGNGITKGALEVSDDEVVGDAEESRTGPGQINGVTTVPRTDERDDEDAGPSFGQLLRASNPDIIDVTTSFDDQIAANKALVTAEGAKAVQVPSGNSLGTVLSQALRTNDKDLLESCLQVRELATIKATIQRLQSPLVATLMQRLAERLHKRPGRAGPLLVWIQWSLVTHGGYLAGQPQVVRKLRSLRQVVRDRACSLQPLITLKGKLDMLSAQVELRRVIRAQQSLDDESDEDDDNIIYLDDAGASTSEDSEDELDTRSVVERIRGGPAKFQAVENSSKRDNEGGEEMDGDIPLINGVDGDAAFESLEEEGESQAGDVDGLVDDEAEESDVDEDISSEEEASGSEVDSDDAQDDSDSASSEDEVAMTSTKPQKRSSLLPKR